MTRWAFYVIAVVLAIYLIVAAHTRAAESLSTPTDPTEPTDTVPPPASPDPRVAGLERRLAASQAARRRERHSFRHALGTVIHAPVYGNNWIERAFLCIHSYEGSWSDPSAPYFGGVQMDVSFQRSYAPWALAAFGTADHWPVSVQLATAIRAYTAGRGFYPWPRTARACGLL